MSQYVITPARVMMLILIGPTAVIVTALLVQLTRPETFDMQVNSDGVPIVHESSTSGGVGSPGHYQAFCNQLRADRQRTGHSCSTRTNNDFTFNDTTHAAPQPDGH